MPERDRLRQERVRAAGVPHLGSNHQRRRDGYAQVEATARSLLFVYFCFFYKVFLIDLHNIAVKSRKSPIESL